MLGGSIFFYKVLEKILPFALTLGSIKGVKSDPVTWFMQNIPGCTWFCASALHVILQNLISARFAKVITEACFISRKNYFLCCYP